MRRLSDGLNQSSIVERYIQYKHQLGYTPTKAEALTNWIELSYLDVSYNELKRFVKMVEYPRKFVQKVIAG